MKLKIINKFYNNYYLIYNQKKNLSKINVNKFQ